MILSTDELYVPFSVCLIEDGAYNCVLKVLLIEHIRNDMHTDRKLFEYNKKGDA